METVEARIPRSKSWFDQAARAPVVSMTAPTTPPWYVEPSLLSSSRNGRRVATSSGS
ncbi:MAG TPA: hypothetical protein VHZ05_05290 [Acidimicrobiales bacterium]|nr:hypothetical protein [Acidimicrobiales bacterium]